VVEHDGSVYLLNGQTNSVYQYSNNGTYVRTLISAASSNPFDATDIAFGLDGDLYMTLGQTDEIVRYTSNGTFLNVFGSGPGAGADMNSMAFRSDGLYVSDYVGEQILVYDLSGGDPTIVNPAAGQVDDLAFGPAGDLFDTNNTTNTVDDLTTASVFASGFGGNPRGLQFEPDGFLYVASQQGNAVDRVSAETGGTASVFASGEGLTNALDFAFVQDSAVAAPEPSTAFLLLVGTVGLHAIRKHLSRRTA
jgi:hypothetical protein